MGKSLRINVKLRMTIEIKKLEVSDLELFSSMVRLFEDVFEMKDFEMPSASHLQHTLRNEGFMAFVATSEGEVVGGMTVYALAQYYAEKKLAYIYDLAVLGKYQRRGIGSRLIELLKNYCRDNGYEEIFVQADTVDDYALRFYRATGINEEEDVRHFYYTL